MRQALEEEINRPTETLSEHPDGRQSYGWWGMVWLMATEATLFAALLVSYFYLRFQSGPEWPPAGIEDPHLTLPLIMSAVLLGSSLPAHLADRAIKHGNVPGLKVWLVTALLMGTAFFLTTVLVEWPETMTDFTATTNSYGSLYFTITGFHTAHLLAGLGFGLWIAFRAWQGAFDVSDHAPIGLFTMYWHFVDVIWIFVFATVYLSPHL